MACTFFSLSYALSWLCYTGHKCYNLHRYVTYSKVWLPCLVFKWCWPCLHFMNDIYSKCISKKFLIKIYILLCKLNSVVSKMMIVFFSGSILVICWVLLTYVDVSVLYHTVRGQSVIKLYVIYNMLEVQFLYSPIVLWK